MSGQQQKVKGVVDIVFLLDATGSMAPCIDALKSNIHTFVSGLTSPDPNGTTVVQDWRAKVVGYRDYEVDGRQALVDQPFVHTVEAVRGQLDALQADGGGDEPESLLEALYAVTTMPATERDAQPLPDHWRYRSGAMRVVVVFTDASYKKRMVAPAGATFEDLKNQILNNRIVLHIFSPAEFYDEYYKPLSALNKCVVKRVTGGANPQDSLAQFTADHANFAKVMEQLGKTLSQTLAAEPIPLA